MMTHARADAFRLGVVALALAPSAVLIGSSLTGHPLTGGADLCLLHSFTGAWCPLCGATRATTALLAGDLSTALGYNPFALLADAWLASLVVRTGLSWWRHRHGEASRALGGRAEWLTVTVALVAFTIVRNAPGAWHLTGRSSAHLFSNHPERI